MKDMLYETMPTITSTSCNERVLQHGDQLQRVAGNGWGAGNLRLSFQAHLLCMHDFELTPLMGEPLSPLPVKDLIQITDIDDRDTVPALPFDISEMPKIKNSSNAREYLKRLTKDFETYEKNQLGKKTRAFVFMQPKMLDTYRTAAKEKLGPMNAGGAIRGLQIICKAIIDLRESDREFVKAGVPLVEQALREIPNSDQKALSFRLRRHANKEIYGTFIHLVQALISEDYVADLRRLNPYILPNQLDTLLKNTGLLLLRANRSSFLGLVLGKLQKVSNLLMDLSVQGFISIGYPAIDAIAALRAQGFDTVKAAKTLENNAKSQKDILGGGDTPDPDEDVKAGVLLRYCGYDKARAATLYAGVRNLAAVGDGDGDSAGIRDGDGTAAADDAATAAAAAAAPGQAEIEEAKRILSLHKRKCSLYGSVIRGFKRPFAEREMSSGKQLEICEKLSQEASSCISLLRVKRYIFKGAAAGGVEEKGQDDISSYDPRMLLFEFQTGFILRRRQVEAVSDFVVAGTKKLVAERQRVQQMIMGSGKTAVIAPLVTLMLATDKALIVQAMPAALLDMNIGVMRSVFSSVITKRVVHLKFGRTFPNDPIRLKKLHGKILKTREAAGVVVTTPVTLKSMMLKMVELLVLVRGADFSKIESRQLRSVWGKKLVSKIQNASECADLVGEIIKLFGTSGGQVKDGLLTGNTAKGTLVMDEVDLLLHPLRSELNFPIGEKKSYPIAPDRWNMPIFLLDSIFWIEYGAVQVNVPAEFKAECKIIVSDMLKAIRSGRKKLAVQLVPHFMLLAPRFYEDKLKGILSRWLTVWFVMQADMKKVMATALKKLGDPRVKTPRELCAAYLTSDMETVKKLANGLAALPGLPGAPQKAKLEHVLRLLHLGREWIWSYFAHCVGKANRVGYGLLSPHDIQRNPYMASARKWLAVPFVGKDVPSSASEFANPEVLIGLTILAYRHEGMRVRDIGKLMTKVKKDLLKEPGEIQHRPSFRRYQEWTENAAGSYQVRRRRRIAQSQADGDNSGSEENFGPTAEKLLAKVEKDLTLLQLSDEIAVGNLTQLLGSSPSLCTEYLADWIFPEVMETQMQKISASGQALGARTIFDTRFGFSGTPSSLVPQEMGRCEFELGAEGKIISYCCDPKIFSHSVKRRWSPRSLLDDIASYKDGEFLALIDTGALITGMTNFEVAKYLLRKGLKGLDGVVYLDEMDRKMVLTRTADEPIPLNQCGLAWDKRFTFYDQIHTTGMDIKQSLQAQAVITVSKDMTMRDYSQGCWRMRGIGIGQTLHIYLVEEIVQLIKDNVPGARQQWKKSKIPALVVALLNIKSCQSEDLQAAQLMQQNASTIWRRRAFRTLLASSSTIIESDIKAGRPKTRFQKNELLAKSIDIFVDKLDFDVSVTMKDAESTAGEFWFWGWGAQRPFPSSYGVRMGLLFVQPALKARVHSNSQQTHLSFTRHARRYLQGANSVPARLETSWRRRRRPHRPTRRVHGARGQRKGRGHGRRNSGCLSQLGDGPRARTGAGEAEGAGEAGRDCLWQGERRGLGMESRPHRDQRCWGRKCHVQGRPISSACRVHPALGHTSCQVRP